MSNQPCHLSSQTWVGWPVQLDLSWTLWPENAFLKFNNILDQNQYFFFYVAKDCNNLSLSSNFFRIKTSLYSAHSKECAIICNARSVPFHGKWIFLNFSLQKKNFWICKFIHQEPIFIKENGLKYRFSTLDKIKSWF